MQSPHGVEAVGAVRRGAKMAGLTGLEPATSCVTGRRSNQLNYNPQTNGGLGPPQ